MASVLSEHYTTNDPIVDVSSDRITLTASGTPGIAALAHACDVAASRTRAGAVTIIAVSDFVGLTGSLGWFAYLLAGRGLGSILMCNSEPAVAIPGTGVPFGGTNPLAIGLPGTPPFVSDFASTVMSHGDVAVRRLTGEPLGEGVVVDSRGRPSTRHDDAANGAMLGFGGHKGFVLSVAIELLCGTLAGAKIGTETDRSRGAVMLVFDGSASARPDAVEVARALLRDADESARLSGERLAEVPSDFLWGGTPGAAAAWSADADVDIPDAIVQFLHDNDIRLT